LKDLIKYSVNIIAISLLLLSTTGITVYSHYCSIDGNSKSYRLALSDINSSECNDSDFHNETSDCCSTKCNDQELNGCCKKDTDYLIIRAEYIVPQETDISKTVICSILSLRSFVEKEKNIVVDNDVINSFDQPPPLTGSEITIRFSNLKIAPSDHIV
jgi:hypothetical protein